MKPLTDFTGLLFAVASLVGMLVGVGFSWGLIKGQLKSLMGGQLTFQTQLTEIKGILNDYGERINDNKSEIRHIRDTCPSCQEYRRETD